MSHRERPDDGPRWNWIVDGGIVVLLLCLTIPAWLSH